jgi:hypothetical protein
VNREQWWKQTIRGEKEKYSEKPLSQFNISRRKSQMNWAVIKYNFRGYNCQITI